jgi:photosystem II stability/assembly factor-like uncharacterized protein
LNQYDSSITSLAYGNGTWCAGGSFFFNHLETSTNNGRTWTDRYYDPNVPFDLSVAYGNGTFAAVGYSGNIRYSTDSGLTWHFGPSPTGTMLRCVAYGNATWVAVGDDGTIVTSADAQLWILQPTTTIPCCGQIGYGAGTFVVVSGNHIFTSANASDWTSRTNPAPSSRSLHHVAYGGGAWVAVGDSGTIVLSTDSGGTWTLLNSGTTINLFGVAYGTGMWVAVGNNGTIITSQAVGGGEPPLVPTVQIQRAVEISWQSQAEAVYQVQYSTNMTNWQDIGASMVGDGQPQKFYDGAVQPAKRFYRVQIK